MSAIDRLERWLDDGFVALNTELEEAYYRARRELLPERPDLVALAERILVEGAALVRAVVAEDALPDDDDDRYRLLGAVGGYLAACRRHRVGDPGTLAPAWSLAIRLAGPLGVAPRYVFAHQALYGYRTFTTLPDEHLFVTRNAIGVLAYQRAAAALRRVAVMGVTGPAAAYPLADAAAALDDVRDSNRLLAETLDVDRFFLNVRPYFKPYRVGDNEYRGTNAGDLAAVNEIDLLLGLCRADDPFYRRVMAEKQPYLPPGDQAVLSSAIGLGSLLDRFLAVAAAGPLTGQVRTNAELFLAACRAHGAASALHHNRLVLPFLAAPAEKAPPQEQEELTASGPPLGVVLATLQRLSDLRAARARPDLPEPAASLGRLRAALAAPVGAGPVGRGPLGVPPLDARLLDAGPVRVH